MSDERIERVLVVGAGTMGQQISLQCATWGLSVNLYDISEQALENAGPALTRLARRMAQDTGRSERDVDDILTRITFLTDPDRAAADVDLLSESIPEDVWLKRRVFAQFNRLCPPHTVFTTNSSTLLPRELARHTGRPQRFSALHFHPDVWIANVVDILPARQAPPELADILKSFALRIDQIPIVLQTDLRGFVVNRFLSLIFRAAMDMVTREKVSIEDVDRAFTGVFGTPHGPFGIMDLIGLDTMLSIYEFWRRRLWQIPRLDPVFRRNTRLLKSYVDRGWLGRKTGRGFFEYPCGDQAAAPRLSTAADDSRNALD